MKVKLDLTEAQWQSQIADLAKMFGWLFYHTWRSFHSPAGFPDCVLTRAGRTIIAELKTNKRKSKLSPAQARWLWELRKTPGLEVFVWRPRQFDKVVEILK